MTPRSTAQQVQRTGIFARSRFFPAFFTTFLIATVGLTPLGASRCYSQYAPTANTPFSALSPQEPNAENQPAGDAALANRQSSVAERFKRLEALLLRLSELEAGENPARSALLQQAAKLGKEQQLGDLLARAASSLEKQQISEAIEDQKQGRDRLKQLLELLQSENRGKRVREERDQVRRWIEETNRLLRMQGSLRGRTEGGQKASQAARDQQRLEDKAADIASQLGSDDSESADSDESQSATQESNDGSESDTADKQSSENADDRGKDSDSNPNDADSQNNSESSGKPNSSDDSDESKSSDSDNQTEDGKSESDASGTAQAQQDASDSKDGQPQGDQSDSNQSSENKSSNSESDPSGKQSENGQSSEGDNSDSSQSEGQQSQGQQSQGQQSQGQQSQGQQSQGQQSQGQQSQGQQSQGQQSQGQQSQGQQSQGQQSQGQQQQQPQSPTERAKQRIEQAKKEMREAKRALDESEDNPDKRREAIDKQLAAEENLRDAIEELEQILRQLREEEIERSLASLEDRFRRMLDMQNKVLDETTRLLEIAGEDPNNRQVGIKANSLSKEENKILAEGERAFLLLREEGSSAAFPEAVEQLNSDIANVAERLSDGNVDNLTVSIESEIVSSLEEMIEALVAVQKENEEKRQQQQQQQGQPQQMQQGDQPLVDQLAELRLILTLQKRINKRTDVMSKMLDDPQDAVGQAESKDIVKELRTLSDRQSKIGKVTRNLLQTDE